MAIQHFKDVEGGENKGLEDLEVPFLQDAKVVDSDDGASKGSGSIGMVLLCTFVAVCGSFEFGSCVGYSAPSQAAIREDLKLTLAQAMRLSSGFCIAGWCAVYFSMGAISLDIGRFLAGYGIGVFSYVIPVFIAEIAPKNLRGGLTTLNQAKVGREKDFMVALRRLRGKNANISDEAANIQAYIETLQSLPKATMLDLLDSKYIRAVIIALGLMIFQQLGGINGVGFYASQTFAAAGLSSSKIGTVAYAIVQVSATGTFLGCFLTGAAFFLKTYIASFSIGMGAVPWVIMSEIFPIHVKGVAGSLVVLVNWLGAWAVSYTFNFLMSWSSTDSARNKGEDTRRNSGLPQVIDKICSEIPGKLYQQHGEVPLEGYCDTKMKVVKTLPDAFARKCIDG
ncbi:hypothetical protein RJ639_027520 [Escallonia herrerae]|uniref:Major facilitator superfamily (MFS) profile domain-containing protein n=1 Tax=Escallonia herrerae TaxID=1293975 RepID=A0AA88XHP6_9ASTE|nr:hypothetical protein RJ639_027520 [Escallonia herrerae]